MPPTEEAGPPNTTVTLTGTGIPHPSPGRAGPGTLVRYGDIHLQFDAGRATVQHTPSGPLVIVSPEGEAATFARTMFDIYADDIASRTAHVQPGPPEIDLRTFDTSFEPQTVWRSDDGAVTVDSVGVHNEPIEGAVAYRVTTPTGVVVIGTDVRQGGYTGELTVGDDLTTVSANRVREVQP